VGWAGGEGETNFYNTIAGGGGSLTTSHPPLHRLPNRWRIKKEFYKDYYAREFRRIAVV